MWHTDTFFLRWTNFAFQLFKASHLVVDSGTTQNYGFVYGADQLISQWLYYWLHWRWTLRNQRWTKNKTELFHGFLKPFNTSMWSFQETCTLSPCPSTNRKPVLPIIMYVGVSLHCMSVPHWQGHVISIDEYSWPPNTSAQTTLTIVHHGARRLAYTFLRLHERHIKVTFSLIAHTRFPLILWCQ
jgi:hypothetical protein